MAAELDIGIDASRLATVRECSVLERMPKWLICVPLVVQWLWLSLRYASATVPSAANPRITSGGLVGEGKLEYFRGMGPLARSLTAAHCPVFNDGTATQAALLQAMRQGGLAFSVVAKPDLGLCGYGVRLLPDMAALNAYLAAFPTGETVVLQSYLPQEGEAGIFYARDPATGEGRIIGRPGAAVFSARDGRRPQHRGRTRGRRSACAPHRTLAAARVPRAIVQRAGGRAAGAAGHHRFDPRRRLYRDGAALITPELTHAVDAVDAVDAVARDMPEFHFGRFDVRFESLRELAAGRGFTIMEINGAGSEAIEAWDPDTGVMEGFRMIFAKQRLLFAIGAAQRRAGVRPIGLLALARLNRRQQRLIAQYPPSN